MYSKKDVKRISILISVCVLIIVFLFLFLVSVGVYSYLIKSDNFNIVKALTKYNSILELYNNNYISDFDKENALEMAIDYAIAGVVESTSDKYGYYIPASEASVTGSRIITGDYEGLGLGLIYNEDNTIEIITVIENSPAGYVDVQVGDKITKINQMPVTKDVYQNFADSLKRKVINSVYFEINGVREVYIEVGPVISEKIKVDIVDNIGYISIYNFVPDTVELFKNAIDLLVDNNVDKIIFDLRDNSGGNADVVVEMLDYIVKDDLIVECDYTHREAQIIMADSFSKLSENISIYLVVNGNTASASELFVMTLQDLRNAVVIGQTTYGKSTVLSLFSLRDDSILCMSVGTYYSKSHRNIEGIGIEPDIYLDDSEVLLELKDISFLYSLS